MQDTVNPMRYVIIAVLVVGAFFGAYRFASARSNPQVPSGSAGQLASSGAVQAGGSAAGDPAAGGCACCGSTAPTKDGVTGDKVEGAAAVEGDVQKIDIDLSAGYYQPNVIKLKAGVPAEVTFGQSTGCTAQVISPDLGFSEDLSAGPRTVKLGALEKGEYAFSCGMEMVFGKIVVE